MQRKLALFCSGLFISLHSAAAPSDLFLQAKDLAAGPSSSALHVTLAADAVNDTIDVFDLRENEGLTDTSAGDYQGFHLAAQYDFSPAWSIEGAYWRREIDYSDDRNKIHSALLGARFSPAFNLSQDNAVSFRGSFWLNQADTLNKTSPTQVNARTFNQLSVDSPEDWQLQLDAIFSRRLDPMNQLNAFASIGYSKVEVSGLDIQALYQGCLMNIAVNSSNQYTGNLARPCDVGGIILNDMQVQGNASDYGLDIQQDLNYDSYFASAGGSWSWRYKKFESQLAYQYQRLWRDRIDDRVSSFGNQAIKDNHTLGAKFSYDFSPHITGFLQGELYQHNFVGQIPFLYNSITADRLDKRYGLASLGVQLHHF